jgi:DNA-directed RNA polymerase specialized sigma24 family protein
MTRATKAAAPLDAPPRLVIEDLCAPSILERLIGEAEPYLRRAAAYIAEDFPAARADLVQEARITLWQLDLTRFPQSAATYLKRILYTRMLRVYHTECLEGLTTGWSPHADRGKRKAPRKAPAAPPRMPKAA